MDGIFCSADKSSMDNDWENRSVGRVMQADSFESAVNALMAARDHVFAK